MLDTVESLIARSLLGRIETADGEARLVMLETIREYGLERLAELGTVEAVRRWHAEHFLALAEEAVPHLRGPEQRRWLDRLEADHDNFRAALEWSLRAGRTRAGSTARRRVGLVLADAQLHQRGPALAGGGVSDPPGADARARLGALYGAGWLAHYQRDGAAARLMLDESRAIALELGDRWSLAWGAYLLGRVAYFDGDAPSAKLCAAECQQIGVDLGDEWLVAFGLHLRGLASHIESDFATARELYAQSLVIRRRLGYQEGVGILLQLSGDGGPAPG